MRREILLTKKIEIFLKDKHKWQNPDSTQIKRNRGRPTGEESGLLGMILCRIHPTKDESLKVNNLQLIATSSSQDMFHEIMQQQFALDREANMEEMRHETRAGVIFIKPQHT